MTSRKPASKTSLHLQKLPSGELIDQYGRILEQYTDANGKSDIRPTGRVGTPPTSGGK